MPNALTTTSKPGLLSQWGTKAKKWITGNVAPSDDIQLSDAYSYDGQTTVAALLGSGRRQARTRQAIYEKWSHMEGDPIISSALTLQVTAALGGHETTGDTVFIEKTPEADKNKQLGAIVEEITADLMPLFNKIAFNVAYNAVAFGDAYARPYLKQGVGLVDLCTDEMIRPPLVQPYERGSKTVGYHVYIGNKQIEKLSVAQLVRLKMPRTVWVPQVSVVEKAWRTAISEDDVEKLPLLPSLAGGSFLYNAEEAYDNLYQTLLGLVGQRWMDSIDEQMVGVNLQSMTKDQQKTFLDSIVKMLKKSKELAEGAVKGGRPVLEKIRHVIPMFGDKQVTQIGPMSAGSGRGANLSIDDVMMHAKMLSGSLGVDLSMLGFSELLSGGMGDGGFFRVSAQVAQRSQVIRGSLSDFFNALVDLHTLYRYGVVFEPAKRPWVMNYYGSISALETEKQRTRADAMNSGAMLVQTMAQFKDMGADKELMEAFLSKLMLMDEDVAKLIAKIVDMKPPEPAGGGFGGDGGGGGEPFAVPGGTGSAPEGE
jgi:hypothetical protein